MLEKPARRSNSAPEIPSSTKMLASSTLQPFRAAYWRACSICRVTDFCSSSTLRCSVDLRA